VDRDEEPDMVGFVVVVKECVVEVYQDFLILIKLDALVDRPEELLRLLQL